MTRESLGILTDDLLSTASRLKGLVNEREWENAHTRAKEVLGLASRTFARISAILDAQSELES